jgi:DNA-binding transcriptional regulator YdaS (Cro superfamily)
MTDDLTPFEALQKAVATAGGQSALARICEVSQTAVWKWLQSSKRVPADYVLRIEASTSVSRHHLRPDIYPSTLPATGVPIDLVDQTDDVACDRPAVLQSRDAA